MANISTYLENILKAVYGKDVRQSIHDGIEKINEDVESNIEAETGRVQAENERVQAETERELFADGLEQKVLSGYFKGDKGDEGLNAYEVAVNEGFIGTELEWLESLKGEKGDDGQIAPSSTIEFEDYTVNTPLTATEALENLVSNTSIAILLSNIKAFLMSAMTKSNIVNNLTTTLEGFVLDARMGKQLKDEVNTLNNSLNNIGTTYSSYKSQADCAGNAWVLITGGASLSLPPGKYVLIASLLTKNTTARCIIQWAHNQARQQTMTGTTGLTYGMTLMDIIDLSGATENTSVNINGWQDIAVSYYDIMLVAIRII